MSREIENKAKEYLINQFKSDEYKFSDKIKKVDNGFDLWLEYKKTGKKKKIELKSTGGKFEKNSDLFQKLYFSAENEVKYFKSGDTLIIRVFLGDKPPKVFLINNSILKDGAEFKEEFRAKIIGTKNYHGISEIT